MNWKLALTLAFSAAVCGCAATQTLIEKRNLDVQTKMSESIFLDPVAPGQQTIFVQIRNTSDKPDFDVRPLVLSAIQARGWTVTDDPEKAQFMLQANVLSVGKTTPATAMQAFGGGYGSPLSGALTGLAIAGATHNYSAGGLATAGLIGGAASLVGDALVKDVYFAAITDLQVSQRVKPGESVTVHGSQNLTQGTSGSDQATYTETTNWKRYRTRVLSSANQANLDWTDAEPALEKGFAQVVAGLF
jgi:hypothetical protein